MGLHWMDVSITPQLSSGSLPPFCIHVSSRNNYSRVMLLQKEVLKGKISVRYSSHVFHLTQTKNFAFFHRCWGKIPQLFLSSEACPLLSCWDVPFCSGFSTAAAVNYDNFTRCLCPVTEIKDFNLSQPFLFLICWGKTVSHWHCNIQAKLYYYKVM